MSARHMAKCHITEGAEASTYQTQTASITCVQGAVDLKRREFRPSSRTRCFHGTMHEFGCGEEPPNKKKQRSERFQTAKSRAQACNRIGGVGRLCRSAHFLWCSSCLVPRSHGGRVRRGTPPDGGGTGRGPNCLSTTLMHSACAHHNNLWYTKQRMLCTVDTGLPRTCAALRQSAHAIPNTGVPEPCRLTSPYVKLLRQAEGILSCSAVKASQQELDGSQDFPPLRPLLSCNRRQRRRG